MTGVVNTLTRHPLASLYAVIALVTAGRLVVLLFTPLQLGPDEAQYWSWSLQPDFGYFSKPPMIAWVIGLTTSVCGDGEYCIRMSAPLFHALTTVFVMLAARRLYDARVGLWAALTYLLMPGTSFSSLLITTDVPLLCYWALGLWALAELRQNAQPKWAIVMGIAIGLGLLSKYAMLYFILGMSITLLISAPTRRMLFSRNGVIMLAVATLVFAPNVIWNLLNSFATVQHTASNANWNTDKLFNFGHIFEFLGAQAGIIGPVAAGIMVWGLAKLWKYRDFDHPDTLLIALSMPIIVIVSLQAFISRANANWAAPAFIALCILSCAWATRANLFKLFTLNTAINAALGITLSALAVSPSIVAAVGQENAVKRLRGWDEAGRTIITIASSAPFTSILSDDREDMASLYYYTRARSLPLRMWPSKNPGNEYEAAYALTPEVADFVLFVTRKEKVELITSAFASSERIGKIETRLDSKRTRVFYVYALKGPVTASTFPSFSNRPYTE